MFRVLSFFTTGLLLVAARRRTAVFLSESEDNSPFTPQQSHACRYLAVPSPYGRYLAVVSSAELVNDALHALLDGLDLVGMSEEAKAARKLAAETLLGLTMSFFGYDFQKVAGNGVLLPRPQLSSSSSTAGGRSTGGGSAAVIDNVKVDETKYMSTADRLGSKADQDVVLGWVENDTHEDTVFSLGSGIQKIASHILPPAQRSSGRGYLKLCPADIMNNQRRLRAASQQEQGWKPGEEDARAPVIFLPPFTGTNFCNVCKDFELALGSKDFGFKDADFGVAQCLDGEERWGLFRRRCVVVNSSGNGARGTSYRCTEKLWLCVVHCASFISS